MPQILGSHPIAFARAPNGRCFLSLHTMTYENKNGEKRPYFMCARGEAPTPPDQKTPDAVVVVGIHTDDEPKLILTREFRVPLGRKEIGFPAGLIDEKDFAAANGDPQEAAKAAAVREFREETGLTFDPIGDVSPINLYSSAGMTDESVCIVMGHASGTPSTEFQEASEDIEIIPVTFDELRAMMENDKDVAYGKVAWPFLWAFKAIGGFTL